jgi:hypothetical protein
VLRFPSLEESFVHFASYVRLALFVMAGSLLLSACSNGGASPAAAEGNLPAATMFGAAAHPAPEAKGHLAGIVYAGAQQTVYAFDRRNPGGNGPLCTIALNGFVSGMNADPQGNLWVGLNGTGPLSVQEYGPLCGHAETTLSAPGIPTGVAFAGDGTIYVSDGNQGPSAPGLIDVYANGASSPTGTLTDPSISSVYAVAVDAPGDVFGLFSNASGQFSIIEFPGGGMPGKVLAITGLKAGTNLFFDRKTDLIVSDVGNSRLDIYAPPYSGAPKRTVNVPNFPLACVLGQHEMRIFCADAESQVEALAYPRGTFEYSYGGMTATPTSIATYPL